MSDLVKEWLVSKVRDFMRDHPETNNLIDDNETSNELILLCMGKAINNFNAMPPHIASYTYEDFPSVGMLIDGTVCQVIRSKAIQCARNSLTYSDGGIDVTDQEKHRDYIAIADLFCRDFTENASKLKISKNIESMLEYGGYDGLGDGVPSEYSLINGIPYDK